MRVRGGKRESAEAAKAHLAIEPPQTQGRGTAACGDGGNGGVVGGCTLYIWETDTDDDDDDTPAESREEEKKHMSNRLHANLGHFLGFTMVLKGCLDVCKDFE